MPPTFQISTDTASYMVVPDQYWQMLEDPTGKLTINQVSSPAFDTKFHVNTTATKGYNYAITDYWFRYTFKNTLTRPVKLAIDVAVYRAQLYTRNANGSWKTQITGPSVPKAKRAGLKRALFFLQTIQPGEEIVFYEKEHNAFWLSKPQVMIRHIGFADAVIRENYINNEKLLVKLSINSIILGILSIAGLINLLFFRIVREKVYLYFSLSLFSFGIWTFMAVGWLLDDEHFSLHRTIQYLSIAFFFFFVMHFVRKYLSTASYTPRWDKFLIVASWIGLAAWMESLFLPPSLSYQTFQLTEIISTSIIYTYCPIILITVFCFIRINKAARPGIYALLPALLWMGPLYCYIILIQAFNQQTKQPHAAILAGFQEWNTTALTICLIWMVIGFSWILFERYQNLQQSLVQASLDREIERNQLIASQNEVLEERVAQRTAELVSTQQQLIQSEKLASLGELTAGIAHEIQNPLNFVNNFSEVSVELAAELKEEMNIGNKEEAFALTDAISDNLQKIIHHGKRADAIVKNMLQHSRNNTADKDLTDLNALAEEYLRLAYHGLRAKDKTFNSDLSVVLDPNLPKVNVIPQDIGRVLMNLFNNAFYAVQQKKKSQDDPAFKPSVTLRTIAFENNIQIQVTDNGNGIPEAIKAKILQPFFTTKPTGEGTGLGLSLSYDIIKAHGGQLDVQSTATEGSVFTITLKAQ